VSRRRVVARSSESRAKLRLVAQSSPRPTLEPLPAGRARVRRVDVQQLALGPDGKAFEGKASAMYHSSELIQHYGIGDAGFRAAKMLVRLFVPQLGLILPRWYRVEHLCRPKRVRGKDGKMRLVYPAEGLCPLPDLAPGSDLIREAQKVLGRQLRGEEEVDPAAWFAPAGELEVEIETVGKRPDSKAVARPYSRVVRVLGRKTPEHVDRTQAGIARHPVGGGR
jgi:hypothetical protein